MIGVFVGVVGANVGIESPSERVVFEDWVVEQCGHLIGEFDVDVAIGLEGEVKGKVVVICVDVS